MLTDFIPFAGANNSPKSAALRISPHIRPSIINGHKFYGNSNNWYKNCGSFWGWFNFANTLDNFAISAPLILTGD